MVTSYGVISDADRGTSWDTLETFLQYFVDVRQVDAMLLTGEIGKLEQTLKWLEQREVPTYAIPGSHESVSGWISTLAKFRKKGIVYDAVAYPRIEQADHHLVFVPGSELVAGAGGFYLTDEGPTGMRGNGYFFNPQSLHDVVAEPNKTIIIAHTPPRLSGKDATDYAHFSESDHTDEDGEKHRIVRPGIDEDYYNMCRPADERIPTRRENRGHVGLARAINEIWPHKKEIVIHGHFGERALRACDRDGRPLDEGVYHWNLIYNASMLDMQNASIVYVCSDGNNAAASFERIRLRDIL